MDQGSIRDPNRRDHSPRPAPGWRALGVAPAAAFARARGSAPEPATPAAAGGADQALPRAGEAIGRYEIIRELGRGGMGAVYLARDLELGRRVAVKFLQIASPQLADRFVLEARATARCHHDNIIVIHEVGEHRGHPYMVLEYLRGSTLHELVGNGRRMAPGRAVELMVPVVRALVCAHEHGIVHRDLKPENIFVTESGTVKVLDFGIAKVMPHQHLVPELLAGLERGEPCMPHLLAGLGDNATDHGENALTDHGALIGTVSFMSPEQVCAGAGRGTVDHRTDLWAAGIILFEMLAGDHPLAPARGMEVALSVMQHEPMPGLRSACPSVPDELAAIVDGCLIKDKEQRIATARELLERLEPLLPGRATHRLGADECPYAGLSSFQESDAGRFFGRTRDITAAVARLREQPLLAVVGPSGVGKSSFVRAGVMPALKGSGETWTSLVVRPGRQPMDALVHLLAPMVGEKNMTLAEDMAIHDGLRERLHREPGYMGAVLRHRAHNAEQMIVVFIDQFEELYTLVDDAGERRAFTACLASIADDAAAPLRLVIALRSDFLDRAAEDAHFMAELSRGLFFLTAPDREGMRDALAQPAEMAGYCFEDAAMIEHMLDHLEHTPGALPLLQFAATRLWDTRDRGRRTLTRRSYERLGGIAGALASHADAVLAELAPASQPLARAVLLGLVTPERTRAIAWLDELCELSPQPGEVMGLIEHLVKARLLVVQAGPVETGAAAQSGKTVELVHESLIHGWPVLRRWLDDNQDDAAFLDQLRSAARQWARRGRPSGLLWRGEAMDEARAWQRRYRGELPAVQREFLHAVFAHGARAARLRRAGIAGVITVLSALVAAAAVALVSISDARSEAEAQLARALAAEAEARSERERAVAASAQVERANQALEQNNAELVAAVDAAESARRDAEAARERAEDAQRRAKRNRRRAESKEREARAAESRARHANITLQQLLDEERERVRRLQDQSGTVYSDL